MLEIKHMQHVTQHIMENNSV